jgi:hypothetical protein
VGGGRDVDGVGMPDTTRQAGISVGIRLDCCSSYWSVRLCNLPVMRIHDVAVTAEATVAVIAHACR